MTGTGGSASRIEAAGLTVSVAGWTLPAIDLEVRSGELVAIAGPAGSGKSTLVHLLAGWIPPTGGRIGWPGAPATPPPWSHLTVVPQALALLDELTVGENVGFAARASGAQQDDHAVEDLLDRLDLTRLRHRNVEEISIGERQRVMVVRALAGRPLVVLADEPVAHQDERRGRTIIDLLVEAAAAGAACVVATREPAIAARADRVITLRPVSSGPAGRIGSGEGAE